MKRRYRTAEYRQAVAALREALPDAAITTDIIVGFPGETDEEFEESARFCREMEFARIHVFPYSPRPGTRAAGLPGQVTDRVKKRRRQQMLSLAKEGADRFRRRFSGRTMDILWEQRDDDGVWSGVTGNYIRVHTVSEQDLTNKLLPLMLK
jgi:threonylcarbamoyladenosine tRNA methylthiotransferase MtaB